MTTILNEKPPRRDAAGTYNKAHSIPGFPQFDNLIYIRNTINISFYILILAAFFVAASQRASAAPKEKREGGDLFTIAQIHYHGGGDWYEDKTAMVRLQERVQQEFGIPAANVLRVVELTDDAIFDYPMLFMTGHGNVTFSPEEVVRLRQYLDRGGFLWACDDYGMNDSFRREMKKVYPDHELVELPLDHPIYHSYYDLPKGLPKIHEHAGGPPHGFGISDGKRLTVFYDFNTDIGDGLESPEIHKDPPEKRESAFRMALNIVMLAMKQ